MLPIAEARLMIYEAFWEDAKLVIRLGPCNSELKVLDITAE